MRHILGKFFPILFLFLFMVGLTTGVRAGDEPLTLKRALGIALSRSPLLAAKRHEAEAAGQAERAAAGGLLPQVDAYADYNRLSDPAVVVPIKSFTGAHPTFSRDQYRAGVAVKIPLYEGGRLRAQVTMAQLAEDISESRLKLTVQDLLADVTNVFNRILYLKELVKAREETLSALEKARDDAAARLDVGRIAPVELMRIETQVAGQKQALIESREDERRSRQTLALLLGWDPSREPDVNGTLSSAWLEVPEAIGQEISEAVEGRPDVRKAREEVKRAEAEARLARGLHLPSVDLVGDYSRRAGSGFSADEEVWSGGIALSLNLFSGGVISAQVGEAEARLAAARETLRQARLNARTEVLHAISAMSEAKHRLDVARQAKSTARETYRIEELKYETGAGTVTDSLLAQAAWLQARADELAAMFDVRKAAVDYSLAVGTIDADGCELFLR